MNLWTKLRRFFGGSRAEADPVSTRRTPADPPGRPPVGRTVSVDRDRINRPDRIERGARPPVRIPVNLPDIFNPLDPAMLNTLTISSDLTKIYLINDGNAHAFDLTKDEGVVIGLLGGQLSIVNAVEPDHPGELPDPGGINDNTDQPTSPASMTVELPFNGKSAFNVQFNAALQGLAIIGATDMISTRINPDEPPQIEGDCNLNIFDLNRNNVRMQRDENTLKIWLQAR